MAAATSNDLVAQLRLYRLLETAQLDEVERTLAPQFPEPKPLAKDLLKRGWLTPFQVNQLFNGRGKSLLLGSYIIIERLGGGGMGEVFKARNWKMGTTVALKIIRKDRISDTTALERFHREIRAAAKLAHPNIVRAFDADEVGGTHLFVMEYVEGTDLAKLIKVHGPLPVEQACDFMRQAASGLQHAFERGMVHRDIKPHNLLATVDRQQETVVKILDMGLARVSQVNEEGDSTSSMTQEGAILGTPDYIAPEQAKESHTVDIRADLYSLGCTFYFVLTGSVPFPKGSLLQKLYKHQFDEPAGIETLRPEVPEYVRGVVRKLMAKQPEQRFQTPRDLVNALHPDKLTSLPSDDGQSIALALASAASAAPTVPGTSQGSDTAALWSSIVTPPMTMKPRAGSSSSLLPPIPRKWWYIAGGGGILVLALAQILMGLKSGTGQGRLQETEVVPSPVPDKLAPPKPPEKIDVVTSSVPTQPTKDVDPPPKVIPVPTLPPVAAIPVPVKGAPKPLTKVEEAWLRRVAALMPDKQEEAVVAELRKRNPGFESPVKSQILRGVVTGLEFPTDKVTDLMPVRALLGLKRLGIAGSAPARARSPTCRRSRTCPSFTSTRITRV